MSKIRRGGYVFITWATDHAPRHVHVFREGRLVMKWDLENSRVMRGVTTGRIARLIGELEREGLL